jgi:hypothetical protein
MRKLLATGIVLGLPVIVSSQANATWDAPYYERPAYRYYYSEPPVYGYRYYSEPRVYRYHYYSPRFDRHWDD